MEKMILRQLGNVMKFGDFCKRNLNERIEMDVKSPDDIDIIAQQDDVLNAVGSLIEQVSGWDIEVFKKYVAEQFDIPKASHKHIVQWIMLEANKYCQAEVNVKGEEFVKKEKRDELPGELLNLDYAMIIEKLYRRLRGLEESDKPTPTYIKRMVDMCSEFISDGEEEEEEE